MGLNAQVKSVDENELLNKINGVDYFEPDASSIFTAQEIDLYFYTTYIGNHSVTAAQGNYVYFLYNEQNNCTEAQ